MSRDDRFAKLQQHEAVDCARYLEKLELVAEILREGDHTAAGYSKPHTFLVDLLRIPVREAKQLVAHATAVSPEPTLTGHQPPSELPVTAEAARAGEVSAAHIQVIMTTLDQLPDSVSDETRAAAEADLARVAATMPPHTLTTAAKHLLDHLDPDGAMPSEPELLRPRNVFTCHRTRTGRMKFRGEIDPEAAEELDSLLTSIAMSPHTTDTRTFPERMGDALTDLIHIAATASDLPGRATTMPTVLGTNSVVLDQGRKRRLVTREQRIALITRDRGCAFPHCDRPPRFCDAHHIKHWADGGPTDLNNLVLLCRQHHRILHHSAWQLRMVNGLPEFTPPDWIANRSILPKNYSRVA